MAEIVDVHAREILDSRGNPTLEVEVHLDSGAEGRAAVPSGASTGSGEALELRDDDRRRFGGKGVLQAVRNVERVIAPEIKGMDAAEQALIDRALCQLDGTPQKETPGRQRDPGRVAGLRARRRGRSRAPALPVSGRAQRADASAPAHERDQRRRPRRQPARRPGVHARPGRAAVVRGGAPGRRPRSSTPSSASCGSRSTRPASATRAGSRRTCRARRRRSTCSSAPSRRPATGPARTCGWPSTSRRPSSGARAATTRPARARPGRPTSSSPSTSGSPAGSRWSPSRTACARTTGTGWAALTERLGGRLQLVGDDLFVTSAERLAEGIRRGAANAILIKVNQIGTLTETLDAVELAKSAGYGVVVSHRSGETEDTFIADLAVAVNAGQIKTGSLSRSDRVAKYNQLLRIEEWLGRRRPLAGPATILARGRDVMRRRGSTRPRAGSWSAALLVLAVMAIFGDNGVLRAPAPARRGRHARPRGADARGRERAPLARHRRAAGGPGRHRADRPRGAGAGPARRAGPALPRSARPGESAPTLAPPRRGRPDRRRPSRTGMRWIWLAPYMGWLFAATLLFNLRAAWKLAIDWAGMLTTVRFVRAALRAPRRAARRRRPWRRTRARRSSSRSWPRTRSRGSPRRSTGSSASGTRRDRARCAVVTKADGGCGAASGDAGRAPGTLCQQFLGDLPRLRREAPRAPRHAGAGAEGRAAQLGAPARGARPGARGGRPRSLAGVRRRLRRRLGPRPRHAPLDRRRGARRARARWPTRG